MSMLVLGLILFLGIHSVRIVADDWRSRTIARIGEGTWKGVYSVISIAGFALIVYGYSSAREVPQVLWTPLAWGRTVTVLLMLVSLILLGGYFARASRLARAVHHPMLWSVVVFSVGHLLANGTLADLLLFGGLGVWAVFDLMAAYRRDRQAGKSYPVGSWGATLANVGIGVGLWLLLLLGGHAWLFGVSPIA